MPWAIVLGALASALQISLPAPLMQTPGLLADAASPVALFTIGAVLARSQLNSSVRTPLTHQLPVTVIKLIIRPVLVGLSGLSAFALGLPLDRFALTVCGAGCRIAERQQRRATGRTLRRRQRPHRAHYFAVDSAGFLHIFRVCCVVDLRLSGWKYKWEVPLTQSNRGLAAIKNIAFVRSRINREFSDAQ